MIQPVALHHAVESVAANLPTLVDVVVRSSLVLLLALVVTTLMRRASAAARHTVWVCAVLVALLIPLIGRVAPRWEARVLPASWSTASASTVSGSQIGDATVAATLSDANASVQRADSIVRAADPVPRAAPVAPVAPFPVITRHAAAAAAPTTGESTHSWSLGDWIAFVWIAGAVLVLLRLALGTGIVWSTARHARRVDDAEWLLLVQRKARELGIARPVILLASPRQMVPVTWGVIYPIVLLPESALAWEPARREAVLVHELAHVGRLDALTHTIVQLAVAAFWFDPFVWIAARHVRSERERACDDLVLAHGARASAYADDLLSMVRSLTRNTEPAFAALAMARRSEFEGRMLAILDPRADRRRIGARGAVLAFACSLAIAFPLAALRPLPRSANAAAIPQAAPSSVHAMRAIGESAHVHEHSDDTGLHTATVSGGPSNLTCSLRNGRHVSINSDGGETNFLLSNDTRCISMVSSGKVTYGDDDASIQSISNGGHVSITEVTESQTRRYDASQTPSGLVEKFYIGGDEVANDDASHAWLRGVIQQIVRQDAALAPARARRIRARSGVPGVLAEVRSLQGDYIKTAYLDALLSQGGLNADSLHLITTTGVDQLTSDYYKSEFLGHVARLSRDGATASTMANAARSIQSDYYRRQVLSTALEGDGDKLAVARQVVDASTSMNSDYDRAEVLEDLLGRGRLGDGLTVYVIQSAGGINNDYYRAVVLDSVIATQPVGAKPVYTALLQAAKGITSDYYHSQVLMRLLQTKSVPPEAVAATLGSATDLSSDYEKANVLVAAAATPAIRNQSVRDAYVAAAKTLNDGTDARRAISALLP